MLSDAEKRFIQRALRKNAPATFVAHHVWVCRQLKVDPDLQKLEEVAAECERFVLYAEDVDATNPARPS